MELGALQVDQAMLPDAEQKVGTPPVYIVIIAILVIIVIIAGRSRTTMLTQGSECV